MRRDGRGTRSLGAYHTLDPLSPSWSPPRHPGHTTPNRPGAGGHEHGATSPLESSLLISLLSHLGRPESQGQEHPTSHITVCSVLTSRRI